MSLSLMSSVAARVAPVAAVAGLCLGSGLAGMAASRLLPTPVRRHASSQPSVTNSGSGGAAVYEMDRAVDEYLQFHFAPGKDLLPYEPASFSFDFTRRLADKCLAAGQHGRALDIGCSVGGASFELARSFEGVVGVDFSSAFIAAANDMKAKGSRSYTSVVEAQLMETREASIDPAIDRSRCHFEVGDACNLNPGLGAFDAVLAANLLCRLPEPAKFLNDVSGFVNPGGVLVLVSPYSWLPEWTDQSKWVGGFYRDGAPVESKEVVAGILSKSFDLVTEEDMPFLIREHRRKFQLGFSHCAVWRRKQ